MKHRFPRLAETYEVKLKTLSPGREFIVVLSTGMQIPGEVVYKTAGGVAVCLLESIHVEQGEMKQIISRKREIEHWDLETLVVPSKTIRRFPRLLSAVIRFPRLKKGEKVRFPRFK